MAEHNPQPAAGGSKGHHSHKRHGFTGQIGFVMAAAGSAVGVGNLWRFPYLAAKDGGGLFILIYLILTFTFGFTLLTSDIAIGRRTGKNSIKAYAEMSPKWSFLGILTFLVPVLIMTYYAVIGGWITLLRGHRRLDHALHRGLYDRSEPAGRAGQLLHGFHHLAEPVDSLRGDLHAADGLDRL